MGGHSLSEQFSFDGGSLGVDESSIKLSTLSQQQVSNSKNVRNSSRRNKGQQPGTSTSSGSGRKRKLQEKDEESKESGKGDVHGLNDNENVDSESESPSAVVLPTSSSSSTLRKNNLTPVGPSFYRQTMINTNTSRLWAIKRVVAEYDKFRVTKAICHFDRRVTAIEWHTDFERFPSTMAIGSKGGDVVWYDHSKTAKQIEEDKNIPKDVGGDLPFLHGQGKGGSITAVSDFKLLIHMQNILTFVHFTF
jgi:hypothetical protein